MSLLTAISKAVGKFYTYANEQQLAVIGSDVRGILYYAIF